MPHAAVHQSIHHDDDHNYIRMNNIIFSGKVELVFTVMPYTITRPNKGIRKGGGVLGAAREEITTVA